MHHAAFGTRLDCHGHRNSVTNLQPHIMLGILETKAIEHVEAID